MEIKLNTIKYKHAKTGEVKTITISQTTSIIENQKYHGEKIHTKASANKKMYSSGYVRI